MANPTWPGSLPPTFAIGWTEDPQSGVLETAMDAGPSKVRPRNSASWSRFTGWIFCTTAQRATFYSFWHDTCKQGGQMFDWTHPATGITTSFLFKGGKPKITNLSPDYYKVDLIVESIP